MREFTKTEKSFLKKLVHLKDNNHIEKLKFTNLLSDIIPHYCIKWDYNTNSSSILITIYSDCKEKDIKMIYYDFIDFLNLLEELENKTFIKSIHSPTASEIVHYFYDEAFFSTINNIYIYNSSIGIVSKDTQINIENDNRFVSFSGRLDILNKLKKYYACYIYPTPSLKDFVDNRYKTPEQNRFDKQTCISIIGIIVAFVIGIIPIIIELLFNKC